MTDISVVRNTVSNPQHACIAVQTSGIVKSLLIEGNTCTDPGQESPASTTAADAGISVRVSSPAQFVGSAIEENTIIDDQATRTMSFGVLYSGYSGDGSPSSVIGQNCIHYSSLAASAAGASYTDSHPLVLDRLFLGEAPFSDTLQGCNASGLDGSRSGGKLQKP